MDFVINNYILFIIVGVILLMALIGYIADNKNFEKKPKKSKKDKAILTEKEEQIAEIEVDEPEAKELKSETEVSPIEETPKEEATTNDSMTPVAESIPEGTPTVEESIFGETPVVDSVTPVEEVVSPLETSDEETSAGGLMDSFETPDELNTQSNTVMENLESMEQSSTVNDVTSVPEPQTEVETSQNTETISETATEAPQEEEEKPASEDIWKF